MRHRFRVAGALRARAGRRLFDITVVLGPFGRRGHPAEAPKGVEFIPEIPTTPVGRADKKALRARYGSL